MSCQFFPYGEKEMQYLKKRDAELGTVIDRLGHLDRPLDDDLFRSMVRHIIGQQISAKALATVWDRLLALAGEVTPERLAALRIDELQALGTTFRKAEYIRGFAQRVTSGEFDLEAVRTMPDGEAVRALSALPGIGTWTAEMLLLHCLQRPDVFSYGDLAVLRGMRMVYRLEKIDRKTFLRCKERFSPFGSVASIYFWKVAAGALPGLDDPAARKRE